MTRSGLSEEAQEYRDAIRAGDRRAIARAITMLESTRPEQSSLGQQILEDLVPHTGNAVRVGITGPPGVGKSTFIEALGLRLVGQGHKVAVLAVDPSSPVSGGSILGDKTRMERLSLEPDAFIRPSPSGCALGGVAQRSREAMLVCEAAGYDIVLVETVGIGQSEVTVSSMVDFFLVLLLPGGGDELQGIKKGVIELADAVVVNKADGANVDAAERTRVDYAGALELIRHGEHWRTKALKASAETGEGVAETWDVVMAHRRMLEESGELQAKRREQSRAWMWSLLDEGLMEVFRSHPAVAAQIPRLEAEVQALETTPAAATRTLLALFSGSER